MVKIDRAKSSAEDATFHTADDDIYVNVGGNRKVVRHCLPTSQVTFCAQIFIIVIIDSLCIYKLSKEGLKSLLSDGDHFFLCEENSTYFAILSTTIGYILDPPTPTKSTGSDDQTDGVSTTVTFQPANSRLWNFYCCLLEGGQFKYFTQIALACLLVSVCSIQLCVRSPNCDERTAYFMIITACLTYLLPPIFPGSEQRSTLRVART